MAYGGKCDCCGECRPDFLAIDHVDGGGNKHRKKFSSMFAYYRWIKANSYPTELRLLCHNCNWAEWSPGICPHQIENGGVYPALNRTVQTLNKER